MIRASTAAIVLRSSRKLLDWPMLRATATAGALAERVVVAPVPTLSIALGLIAYFVLTGIVAMRVAFPVAGSSRRIEPR